MRQRFHLLIATIFIATMIAVPAWAQQPPLPRDKVDIIARAAYDNLDKALGPDAKPFTQEQIKALPYPPVPYDMIEFVIHRGHIAGFAAHCKLDWQNKFYNPLMGFLRDRNKNFSDIQWAFVGMLHGTSMGGAEQAVKDEVCSEEMKAQLSKEGK
jgi:hypothetical protein